jgi:signal peptidase I
LTPSRKRPTTLLKEGLSLAFLIAVVLILRTFVFGIYHVPGESMRPTLLPGDSILVNRLAYGVLAPVSGTPLASWKLPARGDVIVFREPDGSGVLVKRVVGVGGDRLEIRSGRLSVNGRQLDEVDLTEADAYVRAEIQPTAARLTREGGDGFHGHYVQHPVGASDTPLDANEFVVPTGRVFCLGDNRGDGPASRFWGFVDAKSVMGRVVRVAYSLRPAGAREANGFERFSRWNRAMQKVR